MGVKAIRGAITVDENTKEAILRETSSLLSEIIKINALCPEEIVFILFTATEDLTAEFPAVAARSMGLRKVPVICARELSVDNSLPMTVRVLVLIDTGKENKEVRHVYLKDAKKLRDDL